MLSLQARNKFKITKDPFSDDVTQAGDVWLSDSMRFTGEYICQTARSGGILAIIGESGAGKTTIRRWSLERLTAEGQNIRVIIPRCVNKARLTASTISDAIIFDLSNEKPQSALEDKGRQIERILINSSRSGYNHVLLIEEAHDLSINILKQLKRFWELEDGFKKLLSIILIGQPEMKENLDEGQKWEAREIIRRMEVVEIEPIGDGKQIASYLDHKFLRAGLDRLKIVSDDGCDALASRLCRQSKTKKVYSTAYPLSINNWIRRALNQAAKLDAPIVDADVINSL